MSLEAWDGKEGRFSLEHHMDVNQIWSVVIIFI